MKVLHVIPTLAVRHGGGDRACAELAESLARAGLEVGVAFGSRPGVEEFVPKGVSLYPVRTELGRDLKGIYGWSVLWRRLLRDLVPAYDITHIHALWNIPSLVATTIARQHSRPYIVQPHGSLHPWKLRHKRLRKWLYGVLFESRILRNAAGIHTESEEDRRDVLRYIHHETVFVVPSGAFPQVIRAPVSHLRVADMWPELANRRFILYLARLDVNKGVDMLLRAFASATPWTLGWKLLIAGPDAANIERDLRHLSDVLGIGDHVVWGGMLSEDAKRLALQQCGLYVLPSLSENFGIAILEALLCGKPVITTTSTPWRCIDEAGAGMVVEPNAQALSLAIAHMCGRSEEELAVMGRVSRSIGDQYSWDNVAVQMIQVYEGIASQDNKGTWKYGREQ